MSLSRTSSSSNYVRMRKSRIKVLFCSLLQCFEPVNTFIPKGCSETKLAIHSSNHVFRSEKFLKHLIYWAHVFLKMFRILCRFQEFNKISTQCFCFLDKCIWIGSRKFPVLWREYVPSPDNGLTNSPKIPDLSKRDAFRPYLCQNDKNVG